MGTAGDADRMGVEGLTMNHLRVARAEDGTSQLDTARRAGLDPTRYWRIEHGYIEPLPAERSAIAAALGKPECAIWPESDVVPAA
jgi:transcriptional regulator with XRE-family HTH domain